MRRYTLDLHGSCAVTRARSAPVRQSRLTFSAAKPVSQALVCVPNSSAVDLMPTCASSTLSCRANNAISPCCTCIRQSAGTPARTQHSLQWQNRRLGSPGGCHRSVVARHDRADPRSSRRDGRGGARGPQMVAWLAPSSSGERAPGAHRWCRRRASSRRRRRTAAARRPNRSCRAPPPSPAARPS